MSSDFEPSLCNTRLNVWEAAIILPVVGRVTTEGHSWEEAKMRLWLVSKAVKMLASKSVKEPRDFTEDEWRSTLQTIKAVMTK